MDNCKRNQFSAWNSMTNEEEKDETKTTKPSQTLI